MDDLVGRQGRHQRGSTDAKRRTVGIVDDDEAVRVSLQFLLETGGHTVETFVSATDLLTSEIQNLGCLIIDDYMPGASGLELARRLRIDGQCIPILLITGAPSSEIAARAAEVGIDRVLGKPPEESDLLSFINRAFAGDDTDRP
jgi:two-component system response regulator FixJ